MIAASAVLVLVAFATLIIGIFQTGLGLIWVSIASSVLAAVFLLLGVVKNRPPKLEAAGTTVSTSSAWGEAPVEYQAPVAEPEPVQQEAPAAMVLDEPEEIEALPVPAPPRRPATPARPATQRASATRTAAARTTGTARTPAAQVKVVVIPDRDKFHKATCRYAKVTGTMKITKSDARREGYKPCGVCKP